MYRHFHEGLLQLVSAGKVTPNYFELSNSKYFFVANLYLLNGISPFRKILLIDSLQHIIDTRFQEGINVTKFFFRTPDIGAITPDALPK
jgi:hypothetical protein